MSHLDKIQPLDDLAATLEKERAQGKTVVHCHGVFDVTHIGHIRHLQDARKRADILVVTLTPDQHVNKGPHRPIFNHDLRAETMASFECVDYVAVNRWPNAIETIGMLKPNIYFKGSDYKKPEDDLTGGIAKEQAAVEAVGGRLEFSDDITFSSTKLINDSLNAFSEDTRAYLSEFRKRHPIDQIKEYVDRIADLKVLIVGETIIDEYLYCQAIGKSGKEPILAVKRTRAEKYAGGTVAVANHVANLVGKTGLATILGTHNTQEDFILEELDERVDFRPSYREDSPTIVKQRFIEDYFFSKLMAVYDFNDSPLLESDDEKFCASLRKILPEYDVVVAVDYGHGTMTDRVIELLSSEAKFLAVNAQSNAGNLGYHTISTYPRMDFACITENEARQEARDRRGDIHTIADDIAKKVSCETIVITRGSRGCLVRSKDGASYQVPALTTKVVDRMGAGDTFLSLAAPCVAVGVPLEVVGFLGNIMGAHAVASVGHRHDIDRTTIFRSVDSLLR